MNLKDLVIEILVLNRQPLSRLRLAKTIYFAHKELIRRKIMQSEDIEYVRMPLGPAPKEFIQSLSAIPEVITYNNLSSRLIYEIEEFLISDANNIEFSDAQIAAREYIEKILTLLRNRSTSSLVEASRDPSWKEHKNGELYQISSSDLKNTFPLPLWSDKFILRREPSLKSPVNDMGKLQANLLRGMVADIVKESTDLEFPDEQKNASANVAPLTVSELQKVMRVLKNILPGGKNEH